MSRSQRLAGMVVVSCACICAAWSSEAPAAPEQPAQLAVHLLDYIGVDYGQAVENGKIKSDDEYKEMQEFTAQVGERVALLPPRAARPDIVAATQHLAQLVSAKADARAVADQASRVRWMLISAYGLEVAPRTAPAVSRAAALYSQHCASCHGSEGRGDGPAANSLDPHPASFHDLERMSNRSLYSLYNSISLGVAGTGMPAFQQLSGDQRWALAFHISTLSVSPEQLKKGESLWRSAGPDDAERRAFANLAGLTTLSANEVRSRYGANAALVQDYLRAHPQVLVRGEPDPIRLAREKLGQSVAAYERGARAAAVELAVSAYLDGFELAESALDNTDRDLRIEVEGEMMSLRGELGRGAPPDAVRNRAERIDMLLARAQEKISGEGLSQASAFVSACVILLREGLEAILLLAAIVAIVVKTGRREAMPWVHAGWMAALVLGMLTWFAAEFLLDISGANREVTEGTTALIAAGMLLYVGFWLHGKAQSRAWSRFLHRQVGAALEKRTVWAMASVSFLAVYRELFEIVLFYQALWAQAGAGAHGAVLAGIGASVAILTIAGWGIFRYGVRLPLGPFFLVMLWLVLLFAFVFAGDGIAKLQEAGAVSLSPIRFMSIPALGIHPTAESLGVQLGVVLLVALSYWAMRRRRRIGLSAGDT